MNYQANNSWPETKWCVLQNKSAMCKEKKVASPFWLFLPEKSNRFLGKCLEHIVITYIISYYDLRLITCCSILWTETCCFNLKSLFGSWNSGNIATKARGSAALSWSLFRIQLMNLKQSDFHWGLFTVLYAPLSLSLSLSLSLNFFIGMNVRWTILQCQG